MLDCEDIVKKALGRDMSDLEIQEAFDQFHDLNDKVRAQAEAQGLRPDILAASRDWTKKAELAAIARKRNAILQIHARAKMLNFCLTAFKGMEAEGIEALMVGSPYLREGSRMSVDESANALGNSYVGQLLTDMGGLGSEHLELFRKNMLDRDIAEALFLMDDPTKFKGPPEAMAIAKNIHAVQERARIDANLAGAWIGKLPGYIVRQSHDQAKISRAGFEAWRDEIFPRLDWSKTLDGVIDPVKNPASAEKFLLETWKALADGHHMRHAQKGGNPLARNAVIGSEAASMSHDRVLHFKSGGDWYDYNAKFGRGGLNEAVLHGLQQSAKATSLMRIFGPSPHATLDWVVEKLMDRLQRAGDINGVTRVRQMRKRFEQNMRILDGTENMDGSVGAASVGRFIRSWM